jgi:hypothetical protein
LFTKPSSPQSGTVTSDTTDLGISDTFTGQEAFFDNMLTISGADASPGDSGSLVTIPSGAGMTALAIVTAVGQNASVVDPTGKLVPQPDVVVACSVQTILTELQKQTGFTLSIA